MPIDDQDIVFGNRGRTFGTVHLTLEFALGGIVFDQVSEVVRRDQIVNCEDLNFLAKQALVTDCAKDQTPDTSKAIDTDLNHF
jgi:hypothetical protein